MKSLELKEALQKKSEFASSLQLQLSAMDLMNILMKAGCRDVEVHVDMYIAYQVHSYQKSFDHHKKRLCLTNVTMKVKTQQHQQKNGNLSRVVVHKYLQVGSEKTLTVTEAADILREIGDQTWEDNCNADYADSQSKAQILIDYMPSLMICSVAGLTIYQYFC